MNSNISVTVSVRKARWILATLSGLMIASTFCMDVHAADAETYIAKRYYVSPMYSRVFADSNRLTKDGNGGIFAVGRQFNDRVNFELYLLGVKYDTRPVSGSADIKAIAGAVSYFPFAKREGALGTWLGGAYGLAGVGFGNGKSDVTTVPSSSQPQYVYEVGVGYLAPLFWGTSLRLDVRYRFDELLRGYDGTSDGDKGGFAEPLVSIGFLVPIGHVAEPAPPPPVPEVVPVARLDSDGDGVIDGTDKCPDTSAGTAVDNVGCPLPPPPPPCNAPNAGERVSLAGCVSGDSIVLHGVNFEFAKAKLTPNAESILDNIGAELVANPKINIELGGYTDSKGGEAYNQRLSEQRAAAVVDYLKSRGVDAARMSAHGYGEEHPVADNDTDAGREMNRRVELKIIASEDGGAKSSGSPSAVPNSEPLGEGSLK